MTERFELLEQIGKGGMGTVWKARDGLTGEIVALKLLHDMYVGDADYVKRFEREVEIARRIHSAHVVQVRGYGSQDGRPFVAMEYVQGRSLKDLLRERRRLEWREAESLFRQLLGALSAAHSAGVLHRDIKPGNILVDGHGQLKVTDFGISRAADLTRMTGSVTVLGTPTYMAPEGQIDERSEIYSAGCVLFEMLGGRPPFEGDSMHAVILKHLREAPNLSEIPNHARTLVGRLLEKEPGRRPATVHEVLGLLGAERGAATGPLASSGTSGAHSRPAVAPSTSAPQSARWTAREIRRLVPDPRSPAIAAAFLDDASGLVVAHLDGRIIVWDTSRGTIRTAKQEYGFGATCIAVAPKARLMAAGRADGAVIVWQMPALREVAFLRATRAGDAAMIAAVDFSTRGDYLACGTWDGRVAVWEFSTGRESYLAKYAGRTTASCGLPTRDLRVVRFETDGRHLLIADSRNTWRWSHSSGQRPEVLGIPGAEVIDVAIDGTLLISEPSQDTIMVREGGGLGLVAASREPGPVVSPVISPLGDTVAYAAGDIVVVRRARPRPGDSKDALVEIQHQHQVRRIAYSPDGKRLVTIDNGGIARVWEIRQEGNA